MAFEFVLEDSVEIYQNPGGQYHHWTILSGRLKSGAIRAGQLVSVPGADGVATVGSALGFMARGQNLGEGVDAESFPDLFGIAVWQLAPLRKTLAPGSVITGCSYEEYMDGFLRVLAEHPERIFHPHGAEHPDVGCEDCEQTLEERPEVVPLLRKLAAGSNAYLAGRAAAALKRYYPDAG
jgi:hypothetical protein